MTAIAMPEIDQRAIARREAIVAGLAAIVGADAVITEEDERRAYETDALHRLSRGAAGRRPAGLHQGGGGGAEVPWA